MRRACNNKNYKMIEAMYKLPCLVFLSLLATSDAFFWSIKTVDQLNVGQYTGRWYEVSSSVIQRMTFQRNSYCTSAVYTEKKGGEIEVFNSGRKNNATGPVNSVYGTAAVPDTSKPGRIVVNFMGSKSSKPNYLVVKLGPPIFGESALYEYSVVTTPYKLMVWVLARDVNVFKEKYEKEVSDFLKSNGYDYFWNRPKNTYQGNDCVYPKPESFLSNV